MRNHRNSRGSADRDFIPKKTNQPPSYAARISAVDQICNREDGPSFFQEIDQKMNVTGDVVDIALPKDRFDDEIKAPPQPAAFVFADSQRRDETVRKVGANITERVFEAVTAPLQAMEIRYPNGTYLK